jgi:DNA-binding response OmpR family regulator
VRRLRVCSLPSMATVLLVEDDPTIRTAVLRALGERGHTVTSAPTAMAGLQAAVTDRPDVVLLDLGLPDLAGRDVLSRLREVVPAAKVVVFTGTDSEERSWFEENAAGYVLKSAELDYLVELLDDVGRAPTQRASARFQADVDSVPLAREFVRRQLREWGTDRMLDQASLVVTELASNAVLHARSPYDVRITHAEGVLRIEVADGDAGTPEPQPFSAVAESGRGIVLVSAMSASWGIDARPDGKVTWAELIPE